MSAQCQIWSNCEDRRTLVKTNNRTTWFVDVSLVTTSRIPSQNWFRVCTFGIYIIFKHMYRPKTVLYRNKTDKFINMFFVFFLSWFIQRGVCFFSNCWKRERLMSEYALSSTIMYFLCRKNTKKSYDLPVFRRHVKSFFN